MKQTMPLRLITLLMLCSVNSAHSQTPPVSSDEATRPMNAQLSSLNPGRRDIISDQLLADSGPLVTSIGTGFGGADESVLQLATLGMTTLGTLARPVDFRVAEDARFSTEVIIEQITLFAYQVNSGSTSTLNEVNLRVWNGVPGEPGSQVVFGDTSTNQLVSTEFSGIYRVTEFTSGNDARPIMSLTVEPNLFLERGTYWFDWQIDGSVDNGPWIPHVTITGVEETGNALRSGDNGETWIALEDNAIEISQGIPIIIEGSLIRSVPANGSLGLLLLMLCVVSLAARHLLRSEPPRSR